MLTEDRKTKIRDEEIFREEVRHNLNSTQRSLEEPGKDLTH